jgi:hypothetical protein
MKMRDFALAIACTLALPGVLRAQEHQQHHGRNQQGQEEQGMMMGMEHGMMGIMGTMLPGPDFLLEQKDALDLSDEQVQHLNELKSQLSELRQAHMSRVKPLHEQAMDALHGDQPDLAAYKSALEAWADEHVTMQVEIARISQKGLAVLTDTQRSNVRFGMRLMHGMHERMMRQGQMMRRMMESMMGGETMGSSQSPGN